MKLKWPASLALVVLAAPPQAISRLERTFPQDVPSVKGWERVHGEIEVAHPRTLIQYEFFVNPLLQAKYEVVRYRVTPMEGDRSSVTEKLQWDGGLRGVRRYECRSGTSARCQWHEMEKGGPQYRDELPVILWVYSLHRQVVLARDAED